MYMLYGIMINNNHFVYIVKKLTCFVHIMCLCHVRTVSIQYE